MNKIKISLSFVVGIVIGIIITIPFLSFKKTSLTLGSNSVASINNRIISSDELYNKIKNEYGLSSTLDIIDEAILNTIYTPNDEDLEKINKKKNELYKLYKDNYGYNKKEFLKSNGFSSVKEFDKYMKVDYYKNLYYQDYLKKLITKNDISSYYDKYVFGSKHVILYSSSNKKDLKKALTYLKNNKIKKDNKDFNNIQIDDLGYVDFTDDIDDNLLSIIKKTSKKKYSKIIEDENLGYVICYIDDVKKVKNISELTDSIKDKIAKKMDLENNNLYYQAFIDLRSNYNIKFYDINLKKSYDYYKKQYK